MTIARYNLKIRCKDKVLIALPTTTKTDGHNSWTFPNDLLSKGTPEECVQSVFKQLTGLEVEDVALNELEYIQRVDEEKVAYKTEIEVRNQIPVSFGSCTLTRYDKTSNMRIPKYVKFKWVPEDELYYWLTRSYCRLDDIHTSYFYPENGK